MLWFSLHNPYPPISVFLSPCSLIIILSNSHSQVRCESQTIYSTHQSVYPTRHCLNSTLMAINEEEDLMCFSIKKLNTTQYRHNSNSNAPSFSLQCACIISTFFYLMLWTGVGRDTSVGIATRYGLDGPEIESRWRRDFPHLSRTALGPNQPRVQWVLGLSRVWNRRSVELTTHPHLAPRLKKEKIYISTPSVSLRGLFYGKSICKGLL